MICKILIRYNDKTVNRSEFVLAENDWNAVRKFDNFLLNMTLNNMMVESMITCKFNFRWVMT